MCPCFYLEKVNMSFKKRQKLKKKKIAATAADRLNPLPSLARRLDTPFPYFMAPFMLWTVLPL